MEHLGLYLNDWIGPLLTLKLISAGFALWLGQEVWLRWRSRKTSRQAE